MVVGVTLNGTVFRGRGDVEWERPCAFKASCDRAHCEDWPAVSRRSTDLTRNNQWCRGSTVLTRNSQWSREYRFNKKQPVVVGKMYSDSIL